MAPLHVQAGLGGGTAAPERTSPVPRPGKEAVADLEGPFSVGTTTSAVAENMEL